MDQESGTSAQAQIPISSEGSLPDSMPVRVNPLQVQQPENTLRDSVLFRFALIGIGFMVFIFSFWHVYVSRNSITVHDQVLSDVIIIDEVVISNPRGGKIKLSINGVSPGGTMVGFSSWLPRGTHSFVGIPLGIPNTENSRGKEIIRPKEGDTIFASLHDVDILELGITPEHTVLRDIFGRPAVKKFIVR